MGLRRNVPKRKSASMNADEESLVSENEFEKSNLHEMETQVMEMDDNETDGSRVESGNDSSLTTKTPEFEGRRTRSGRVIGENSVTPKPKRRPKPKVVKPKRGMRTFPLANRLKVVPIVPKSLEKKPANESGPGSSKNSPENRNTDKDLEGSDSTEPPVPLTEFMAKLNASPSSSSGTAEKADLSELTVELGKSTDCPQESSTGNEVTAGNSKPADVDVGTILARRYRRSLQETEEFALNYISQEFHHPVISCFRELTKRDISTIAGSSKLKKSCNSLEQSVVYLGLLDLLATVNNNPVYGESDTSKLSKPKNISSAVKKILLEFKNIMGTWALSGNEQLSSRYSLILKYLRTLVPMFKKAEFDEGLSNILDCIEKEVTRHKQNQEKIKAMGSAPKGSENSTEKKSSTTEPQEGENRSALNEIILNVDLNVKLDDSDDDDDDISVLKDGRSLQIFGKPLKGSPRSTEFSKKKSKKPKTPLDPGNKESFKSPSTQQKRKAINKTPTSHTASKKTSFPQPKTLAKSFQASDSPKTPTSSTSENTTTGNKTPSAKRSANENLNDVTKKRKIEDGSVKVISNDRTLSIKSFFQPVGTGESSLIAPLKSEKPTVNAFALMMNRSREMAQKKKTDKLNTLPVPTLKVDAVKS